MPAARAARLTGQPSAMRSTRTSLPRGVRQALACGTRAPPATVVSTPTAEGYGPSTRQQPDWELDLGYRSREDLWPMARWSCTMVSLAHGPQRAASRTPASTGFAAPPPAHPQLDR